MSRHVTASIADEEADHTTLSYVTAPFAGTITVLIAARDVVYAGQAVALIETEKIEAAVLAPRCGTVLHMTTQLNAQVEGGDLLMVVE